MLRTVALYVTVMIACVVIAFCFGCRMGRCDKPGAVIPTEGVRPQMATGPAVHGIRMHIQASKPEHAIGDAITVSVELGNDAETDMRVLAPGNLPYMPVLYDADGRAIDPKPEAATLMTRFYMDGVDYFDAVRVIAAGKRLQDSAFQVDDWFSVKKVGTYHLVLMRRLDAALGKGVIVSNLCEIVVSEKKRDGGRS